VAAWGCRVTRFDNTGLPPVNPLPHPTPLHIRSCIARQMHLVRGLDVYQALLAVDAGIRDACAEHDKEQGR
jgi:hypothetical protein